MTHKLIGAAIHNVKGGEAEMRKKSDNEDTLKERHRINKELVAACEAGRLEKVDREGSPVDPRSSRSGMWRRVLSLAETGRPKGKAK